MAEVSSDGLIGMKEYELACKYCDNEEDTFLILGESSIRRNWNEEEKKNWKDKNVNPITFPSGKQTIYFQCTKCKRQAKVSINKINSSEREIPRSLEVG